MSIENGRSDCHIHMVLDGADWRSAIARFSAGANEAAVRSTLLHYRELGYTYLRDGGDRWGAGELAAELAGEYGIVYRTPCFPIYKEGHYGSFIGRSWSNDSEYRALLSQAEKRGAHFIKLMISGLMDFNQFGVITGEPYPAEDIRMMIGEAHDRGFAVMAHANGDAAVFAAAAAGVDSVEHGAYLSDETLCAMAESGTVWVPTLAAVAMLSGCGRFPESVLEPLTALQMEKVRKAAALGVPLACGSDAGAFRVPHGQGGLDEYALLARAIGAGAGELIAAGNTVIREKF